MLPPPSNNSATSHSRGSSKPSSSSEYFRKKAMKRQSRETAATHSINSGSYASGDSQSVISAITMDFYDEDGTTVTSTSTPSYYRGGRRLDPMPEQKRFSDPDAEEVESYLDQLKHHHSVSTNRFSEAGTEDTKKLCAMPRRRSSASGSMEYRLNQTAMKLNDCFLSEESIDEVDGDASKNFVSQDDVSEASEATDGCSMRSLQGTVDEADPFQVGLHGDDDDEDGDDEHYDQPPMPEQQVHHFDSCISLKGSTDMFDDSFQVGLREDDNNLDPFESQVTHKTSNLTSNYNQFRAMQGKRQSVDTVAAMRSGTDSGMFDSCQLGLLEESAVDLPDYSNRYKNQVSEMYSEISMEEYSDTYNDMPPNTSSSPSYRYGHHANSKNMTATTRPGIETQSLQLDDIFGSTTF